jgi:hypothetical protein
MDSKDKVELRVNKVAGGQRNHTYQITGVVTSELMLTPIDLGPIERPLKLASLSWLIQEKMGMYLWWDKETILLPMESRNTIKFDTSMKSPENWDGKMWISGFGFVPPKKVFFLILDFDK